MGRELRPDDVGGIKSAGGQIPFRPMYSIEVYLLDPKPTDTETTPSGIILVWAVNAVGDRGITYLCPQCGHLYPPGYEQLIHAETKEEYVRCPECTVVMPDMMLQTSYGFRTDLLKVAAQVAEVFNNAKRNASIRLRRFKDDKTYHDVIGSVNTAAYEPGLGRMRSGLAQEWVDYPAENLTKDLAGGADVTKLIHNFLKV